MTKIIALLGLLFACASHAEITRIDSYPNVPAQANAFAASPSVDPAVANATIASTRVDLAAPAAALLSAKEGHQLGVALVVPPELQSLPGLATADAWTRLDDKAYARLQVHAEHAVALRAGLQIGRDFPGRVLSLAPSGAIAAELRRRDGLSWSTISEGDTLDLLIEIPADYTYRNGDLSLPLVSYIDSDPHSGSGNGFANIDPTTASCAIDIACSASSVEKATGAASMRILFTRNGSTYACSGTLLGDAAKSYKPYVYTANHCIDSQTVADTVETYWNLQYPTCDAYSFGAPAGVVRLKNGAQLFDHDADNDHAFLLLNDQAPADAVFAGWDTTPLSASKSVLSINHPHADVKKIAYGSIGSPASKYVVVSGTTHTNVWAVDITRGALQEGSSGGGLFTCDSQSCLLRGGLMSMAVAQICTAHLTSSFSRFDVAYPKIKGGLGNTPLRPAALTFKGWPTALSPNTTTAITPLTVTYNDGSSRVVSATLSSSNLVFLYFKDGSIVTRSPSLDIPVDITASYSENGVTLSATNSVIVHSLPVSNAPFAGVRMVAAGGEHTLAVKTDGSLWAWGWNGLGELGDGTTMSSPNPRKIDVGYTSVGAGTMHSAAIKSDGSLWAWGYNANGQIGDGSTSGSRVPKMIGTGYVSVVAGASHTAAIKTDGSLWSWGDNTYGQLGNNAMNYRYPNQVGSGYVSVSAGDNHTVAIKTDGSLWAWGDNSYGQLGNGTTSKTSLPKLIGSDYISVSAGAFHTVAIKNDGSLWAWGDNLDGQLGDGSTINSAVPKLIDTGYASVAAGGFHTVAIKNDGSLWVWGRNASGQLGDGSTSNVWAPKKLGTGYVRAFAGRSDTVVVMSDGNLWAWGYNGFGQLGSGNFSSSLVPAPVISGLTEPIVLSTNDCTFDWLEDHYPSVVAPSRPASQSVDPFAIRYYRDTANYLGVSSADSHLYYQSKSTGLVDLGAIATWAAQAGCK